MFTYLHIKAKKMITHAKLIEDDSYDEPVVQLFINLAERNLRVNKRLVTSICINVCEATAGELTVNWEAKVDDSYTHNTPMLMRDPDSEDDNTETMGKFYWGHAFDKQLKAILIEVGVSEKAANDVTGSEWGMQDVGRASYDACELEAELKEQFEDKLNEVA
jgi:hypothetical protein